MGFIRRFMVVFGLVSSAFDGLTFWLLLALPYLPGRELLGFVPLAPGVLALIIGVTMAYALMAEIAKGMFYRLARPSGGCRAGAAGTGTG